MQNAVSILTPKRDRLSLHSFSICDLFLEVIYAPVLFLEGEFKWIGMHIPNSLPDSKSRMRKLLFVAAVEGKIHHILGLR